MYIIKMEASENGGRPPLQSWTGRKAPEGFALCPDEFFDIFYSTSPAGFVDISVENGTVVNMEINQTAVDAYIKANPEPELTELQQSLEDQVTDLQEMIVDQEYRLTLLELGITE